MVCIIINQWELKVKTSKLLEARENANDQVAIVFNFVSDCLRRWREFSWTSHRAKSSKAKPTSDFFRRSDEFFSDENCSKAWRTLRVKFPSSFVGVNLRPSGHLLNEARSLSLKQKLSSISNWKDSWNAPHDQKKTASCNLDCVLL